MFDINQFVEHVKIVKGRSLESMARRYVRVGKEFEQTTNTYTLANRFWFTAEIVIDEILYRLHTTSIICRDADAVTWYFMECLEYYFTHGVKMGNIMVFPKE